ncbi:MAG: hypothetical protein Q4D71_07265 [Oscillospiraceae bacterium]|nr:hypothetical protein [Oscillospiraceae bacterium]
MQESIEEKIGRRLRNSIMTDDECRASYEINRVLEACVTKEESVLVRKMLRLVDLYENDEEDGDVVNLSSFAMEMTDRELGKYVNGIFSQCRTETERALVDDMLIAINGWNIESLQILPESTFYKY